MLRRFSCPSPKILPLQDFCGKWCNRVHGVEDNHDDGFWASFPTAGDERADDIGAVL